MFPIPHLTYNNIGHRGFVFGLTNVALLALGEVVPMHLRQVA